ncbi:hypothetical protein JRQ81_009617 [Phrynocephalus forsythii]|uniref:Cystatin domain-containing protein n=1 Tax=Phrynocephalus forsythii TaxID=171643 RepID=A0A9Q0XA38_9SAUR|nr:hypothetical protein JRQ81_009617 [Phrynocephalus forsythii]
MAPGSSPVRLGCALLLLLVLCSALSVQSQRLVGGRQEVPVSDPGAQEAAAFAMDAYNQGSNSLYYYKLLRVLKVETQPLSAPRNGIQ